MRAMNDLNPAQIALKTAAAIASFFPGVSVLSLPLSALADHEPELAKAFAGFINKEHVSIGELIAQQNAGIMSEDAMRDTATE